MRVKDLIAELQKFDPETPISGCLDEVWERPAYYDGSLSYVNEDGKIVYTRNGKKVVFDIKGAEDILFDVIWKNSREFGDPPPFEEVQKFFVVDPSYCDREKFDTNLKEDYDKYVAFYKGHLQERIEDVKKQFTKGWKFYQDRMTWYDYRSDGWRVVDENGVEQKYQDIHLHTILKSGIFKRIDYDAVYFEWVLKE